MSPSTTPATQNVAASKAMKGVTFNLKLCACVVTKLYVRDQVACEYVNDKVVWDNDECHKAVCERWCVTKLRACVCDKVVYVLSASDVRDKALCVCDKVVCDKFESDEVMNERWCVAKLCERWCVTKLRVTTLSVTKLCVCV